MAKDHALQTDKCEILEKKAMGTHAGVCGWVYVCVCARTPLRAAGGKCARHIHIMHDEKCFSSTQIVSRDKKGGMESSQLH